MTFVSLFAGIGGIDLGLERAGHTCVGQVEIDDYCQRVLAKHWPDVPRISDVRDFEGHEFGTFDMLTAGYPCQPFSVAGQRRGDTDERHLWPEVNRIIRRVRPRMLLLENVPGHLALGFGSVLGDLAEGGYDTEWRLLSAAEFGAPHLRERLFVLAYPSGPGREECYLPTVASESDIWSDTCRIGKDGFRWPEDKPPILRVGDGVPRQLDRLRALGNSVVPQVAEAIGRRLA